MSYLTGRSPRDANRAPATFGVSSADGVTVEPIEVNPSTGRVLVDASITSSVTSSFAHGQVSVGVAAAQLPSNALTNGVIVQALSTNTVSIYIGNSSGVTTSTGFELQPGQATSIAISNTNLAWAISGSASQGLCFIGS